MQQKTSHIIPWQAKQNLPQWLSWSTSWENVENFTASSKTFCETAFCFINAPCQGTFCMSSPVMNIKSLSNPPNN
jgi:hypothetical protein